MRFLVLTLALAALPAMATEYPLWEGEPIEEYARKANLPATIRINVGNDVPLELRLVPPGVFTMGEGVPPVSGTDFAARIFWCQCVFVGSAAVLLILVVFQIQRSLKAKRRPQFSLARLIAICILGGIVLLAGLDWRGSVRDRDVAKKAYAMELKRYDNFRRYAWPARTVSVHTPFYIGKYEVTNKQYYSIVGGAAEKPDDLPVTGVSWLDAKAFCELVTKKASAQVRLPSEAEWEYACRAGTSTPYSSGSTDLSLDLVGWYKGNSGGNKHPVGQKEPNEYGLYDMHGNVAEWVEDPFHWSYNGAPSTSVPWTVPTPVEMSRDVFYGGMAWDTYRVVRGGAYDHLAHFCTSADRSPEVADRGDRSLGFRICLEAGPVPGQRNETSPGRN